MLSEIYTQAENWLNQDPDTETQTELQQLLHAAKQGNANAQKELTSRFNGRLQFGTAGLRGRLQAGPMGMNRVLVAQAAAGLAKYLQQFDPNPSIVIGYDARKNSDIFARDTAEIMSGFGIKTLLLPRMLPTPVLAFAIQYFDTSAGVMVTASHNPPEDNGYKVYLGKSNGGGQIVSPADRDIASLINTFTTQPISNIPRNKNYTILNEEVIEHYIQKTATLAHASKTNINYVYTAMHGVGKEILLKTINAAQLPLPHLVEQQAEPDATFSTVAFPNPEEKGALDLAIDLAQTHNAEFIIANDPDADRLAVAIPDQNGKWAPLHGNDIGCFLAWHIAKQAQQQGKTGTLACSLVSSPALAEIAKRYHLQYEQTLTGFKYIAKVNNLLFGFEEALGYLVDPDKVRDKDGISAAIAFLDLIGYLKSQGKTLLDYINDFTKEFGAYASGQISIRVNDIKNINILTDSLRLSPPTQIGTINIIEIQDYLKNNEPNNILVYNLNNGNRMIVRPSGTEPKVKIYLDVKGINKVDAQNKLNTFEYDVRTLLRLPQYGNQQC